MSTQHHHHHSDAGPANTDHDGDVTFLDFLRSAAGTAPLRPEPSPSQRQQQQQQQRQSDQRYIASLSYRRSTPYFSHGAQSRNDPAARDPTVVDGLAQHHRSNRHRYQEQQPVQQSTNGLAERKRRHTGLEHARRTHPYPGYPTSARGLASSSNNTTQQAGYSVADVIDLTFSSPPSQQPHSPSNCSMANTNGPGASAIAQALSAARESRQNSDTTLPQWQPDHEVAKCPVCDADFSLIYRRHHCRKCGRVVCARCSPHRITIPRQYIVHPPEHQSLYTTYNHDEATMDTPSDPALGGGEVVRVCNPCVPDPWHPNTGSVPPTRPPPPPPPQLNPYQQLPGEYIGPWNLSDDQLEALRPPPESPYPRPSANAGPRTPLPPGYTRPSDVNRSTPMPLGGRHRSQSHQQTNINDRDPRRTSELSRLFASSSNVDHPSRYMADPSQPRHRGEAPRPPTTSRGHPMEPHPPSRDHQAQLDQLRRTNIDRQAMLDAGRYRRGHPEFDAAVLRLDPYRPGYSSLDSSARDDRVHLRTDPHSRGYPVFNSGPGSPVRSPALPRRQVAEEDECPVCGEEMPPGEARRELHIEECIASRMAPQSTSPPPAPTAVPGSAPAQASRPRAASFRPRGMAKSVATEKDCVDGDGEARECSICLEEYEPGDELGRMECLCVFHVSCIRGWWEKKGVGACPTPHFD